MLLSMGGSSMSYHLDLWATAVFYHVQWGAKLFALAPPTVRNLELLQRWQQRGEPDSGALDGDSGSGSGSGSGGDELFFPQALEGASSAVLVGGSSVLIPAGWIHAVFTPLDSCVLGWNLHTAPQLATSLPLAMADWGGKTAEMCAIARRQPPPRRAPAPLSPPSPSPPTPPRLPPRPPRPPAPQAAALRLWAQGAHRAAVGDGRARRGAARAHRRRAR